MSHTTTAIPAVTDPPERRRRGFPAIRSWADAADAARTAFWGELALALAGVIVLVLGKVHL